MLKDHAHHGTNACKVHMEKTFGLLLARPLASLALAFRVAAFIRLAVRETLTSTLILLILLIESIHLLLPFLLPGQTKQSHTANAQDGQKCSRDVAVDTVVEGITMT